METEIIVAIITACVTALGTWQAVRVQIEKQTVDKYLANRSADQADIRDLRVENRALRAEVKALSEAVTTLQFEHTQLKATHAAIAAWTGVNCPYDNERCLIRAVIQPETRQSSHGNGAASAKP